MKKMDLIDFKDFVEFQNLPYVFGNIDQFKIFYKELKNINFPLGTIKNIPYTILRGGILKQEIKKLLNYQTKLYGKFKELFKFNN